MTLSKVSFSDILRNDYLDHFDTFGENFDFDTFENDTFESVWVDSHPLCNFTFFTTYNSRGSCPQSFNCDLESYCLLGAIVVFVGL